MDCFSQNPYFCSQFKKVVGVKKKFGPHSAFQPFLSQFEEHKLEERGKKEEDNAKIIAAPKKKTTFK